MALPTAALCILTIVILCYILCRKILWRTPPYFVRAQGAHGLVATHQSRMARQYGQEEVRAEQAQLALSKIHSKLSADLLNAGGTPEALRDFDQKLRGAIAISQRLYGDSATTKAQFRLGL